MAIRRSALCVILRGDSSKTRCTSQSPMPACSQASHMKYWRLARAGSYNSIRLTNLHQTNTATVIETTDLLTTAAADDDAVSSASISMPGCPRQFCRLFFLLTPATKRFRRATQTPYNLSHQPGEDPVLSCHRRMASTPPTSRRYRSRKVVVLPRRPTL